MLFTQIEFVIFAAVVFALVASIRNHTAHKLFLLAASYYFYAYWDWRFLGLISLLTAVNYLTGIGLGRTRATRPRKIMLAAALVCSLGLLGFFKYFNFFVGSFQAAFSPLGLELRLMPIILPVGISFYTFQALSYTIDVYRGKIEVCKSVLDFSLFVAFFPQLVAGPIVRASEFLPQLAQLPPVSRHRILAGFRQFTIGLFKKVFLADGLALFVDTFFENAAWFDTPTAWLAVAAYSVQIYCDFSGYSDMAIGMARAMGYDFNVNFNFPYLATSMTEFWRRWHISLSTWLRDYLYIPLGGNRLGTLRTYRNLLLTMVLGGLWHGAAWTFVFWGLLHGCALAVDKWTGWGARGRSGRGFEGTASDAIGWLTTMLVVMVGWVFFRSQHGFGQAVSILQTMFVPTGGVSWHPPFVVLAIALVGLAHLFRVTQLSGLLELRLDRSYTPAVLFTMLCLVIVFPPTGFQPFVYFQF